MKHINILVLFISAVLLLTACSSNVYTHEDILSQDIPAYSISGNLKMSDLSKYRIVYASSMSETELETVTALRNTIHSKTGILLEIVSDVEKKTEKGIIVNKYEILVGNTIRPETEAYMYDCWINAEGYDIVGTKLVICSNSYISSHEEIIQHFITNVLDDMKPDDKYFFSSESDAYLNRHSIVDVLTINGLPVTEYELVSFALDGWETEDDNDFLVRKFQQQLARICGYELPITNIMTVTKDGGTRKGQIYIGIPSSINAAFAFHEPENNYTYSVYTDGTSIYAVGNTSYTAIEASEVLLGLLTPEDNRKEHSVMFPEEMITGTITEQLSILYTNFDDEMYDPQIMESVVYGEHPDLFITTQLDSWQAGSYLEDTYTPYYSCSRLRIDDLLLYCTDRFEIVENAYERFSDTGTSTNKAAFCSYVILRDKVTENMFAVVSSTINESTSSLWLIIEEYINSINLPVIYIGESKHIDYNGTLYNHISDRFSHRSSINNEADFIATDGIIDIIACHDYSASTNQYYSLIQTSQLIDVVFKK